MPIRDQSPEISLVIPCFDDADRLIRRLPELKAGLERRSEHVEVIVVDDGSAADRSEELRRELPWLRVLRLPENRGKGCAVRTGMLAARGRLRFFTDSDLPFGLQPLEEGVRRLTESCDVVIGDRGLPESVYAIHQTTTRKLASWAFTLLISKVVVPGIADTQCGFKGFRGPAAEFLFRRARLDGFAFDVELVFVALQHGFLVGRIPVVLEHAAESTLRLERDTWKMLYEVVKLKWHAMNGDYR